MGTRWYATQPEEVSPLIVKTIPLGPFALHAPLARGGMGQVWRGVHCASGVPVAVKILAPPVGQSGPLLWGFQNEVRQLARLEHPGIVLVLDQGQLDAEAALRSEGSLCEGWPYLVMEYAHAGSLADLERSLRWDELRELLGALLAALAHAHARGVLHRDLKPGNVLLGSEADIRPHPRIADFGLSRAWWEGQELDPFSAAGSPYYMAPEQVRGDLRQQGPWTDLYALGGVAWSLVSGAPMWSGHPVGALLKLRVSRDPPPLLPIMRVPERFEGWLRILLDRDPDRRFRSAAQALAGLESLGEPEPPRATKASASLTWTSESTLVDAVALASPDRHAPGPEDFPRAELAPSWRATLERARPPTSLLGAGLGMLGLRAEPWTGREAELELAWRALQGVARSGQPRALVLRGHPGSGRSRLANLVAELAHEQAGWASWRVRHRPGSAPDADLLVEAARQTGCGGLSGEPLLRHLAETLPHAEAHDVELLASVLDQTGTASPEERRAALLLLLGSAVRDQPAVLVLEDLQWAPGDLALTGQLLESDAPRRHPVLVVLTGRNDLLASDPALSDRLATLEARPDVVVIEPLPLDRDQQTALIARLLPLEERTAEEVRRLSGGSPQLAIGVLADWHRRGELAPGPEGFTHPATTTERLPVGLQRAWESWLEGAIEGLSESSRAGLEAGAALGLAVDRSEWSSVCQAMDLPQDPAPWTVMEDARLVLTTRRGWRFVHELIRDGLAGRSRQAGRWAGLNDACAELFDADGRAGRRGRWLTEAGRTREAATSLLGASEELLVTSDLQLASVLLQQVQSLHDALSLPSNDREVCRAALTRARILSQQHDFEGSDAAAMRCIQGSRRGRHRDLEARALRYRAMSLAKRGDAQLAEPLLHQAQLLAERAGDQENQGACLVQLGVLARLRGDRSGALSLLERALEACRTDGRGPGEADALCELGGTWLQLGQPERAEPLLDEAIARYRAVGDRVGRSRALNNLGEVRRLLGDLDAAAEAYGTSISLHTAIGSHAVLFPLINIGLIHIARRAWLPALEGLERALRLAETTGRRIWVGFVHGALLPPLAATGAWAAWDDHLSAAEEILDQTGFADSDLVECLSLAQQLASQGAEHGRARRVGELAALLEGLLEPQ